MESTQNSLYRSILDTFREKRESLECSYSKYLNQLHAIYDQDLSKLKSHLYLYLINQFEFNQAVSQLNETLCISKIALKLKYGCQLIELKNEEEKQHIDVACRYNSKIIFYSKKNFSLVQLPPIPNDRKIEPEYVFQNKTTKTSSIHRISKNQNDYRKFVVAETLRRKQKKVFYSRMYSCLIKNRKNH